MTKNVTPPAGRQPREMVFLTEKRYFWQKKKRLRQAASRGKKMSKEGPK